MMINQYYKDQVDYDEMISKFGKKLLDMDNEVEQLDDDNELMIDQTQMDEANELNKIQMAKIAQNMKND